VTIVAAQEFQWVFTATKKTGVQGGACFSWVKTERRVSCYYFYLPAGARSSRGVADPPVRTPGQPPSPLPCGGRRGGWRLEAQPGGGHRAPTGRRRASGTARWR